MKFFVDMVPPTVTAQEHKVRTGSGKPVFYAPPELADAREKLAAYVGQHRPPQPLGGAVGLIVVWCFPRGGHPDGAWRVTKPDTDNLQKLLKDVMTELGFWLDDAQVCWETVQKRWAARCGIYIEVEALTDTQRKEQI